MNITKKKRKNLLISVINPNEDDLHKSLSEMKKRIISIFRHAIGKENGLYSTDLFREVYGKEGYSLNVFERAYLWNVLKAMLAQLRANEIVFVVFNGQKFYVLQTEEELKEYEARMDGLIKGIEDTKKKAREWVKKKRYLSI